MSKKIWFQTLVGILLLVLIIKYFLEIKHLLSPFIVIFNTIFIPLLLAGVLFYITLPLQKFLEDKNRNKLIKMNRGGSIATIIVVLLIVVGGLGYLVVNPMTDQVSKLIKNFPTIIEETERGIDYIVTNKDNLPKEIDNIVDSTMASAKDIAMKSGKIIVSTISGTISVTFTLLLVPFFYIFLLKDHEKLGPFIYKFFEGRNKTWVMKTASEINLALSNYVQGQVLISFLLSLMIFIGYTIIGLEYALLLAVFALFMNMIPFIGPWVAFAPAVIIAFLDKPIMVLWVCIITIIAQQVESNIITPNIMGKSLDIHPLTVITIVLAAGGIAGFIGILIAIPTYATIKVIVSNIYKERMHIREKLKKEV